jgi:hypothetical protein
VRFRVGIGGKLGPVRVGVSTRGAGVGVGPLSGGVAASRRSSAGPGCLGVLVIAAGVTLVCAWPWFAATALAVRWGAGSHSAARLWAGVLAETVWVLLVVTLWWAWGHKDRVRWRREKQLNRLLERASALAEAYMSAARVGDDAAAWPRMGTEARRLAAGCRALEGAGAHGALAAELRPLYLDLEQAFAACDERRVQATFGAVGECLRRHAGTAVT